MATLPEIGTPGATARTNSSRSTNDPAQQVKDQAHQAAASLGDQAADMRHQVEDKAKEQLADQKSRATEQLGGIQEALKQTTETLRDNGQEPVANAVEQAAGQVERLNSYLQNRSVGDLLSDAEQFARREPGLFLGAAALIGLAAGRFVRASRPTPNYDRSGGSYGRGHLPRPMYDARYDAPAYRGGYDPQTGGYAAPLAGAPTDRALTGDYSGGTYERAAMNRPASGGMTSGSTISNDPLRNA